MKNKPKYPFLSFTAVIVLLTLSMFAIGVIGSSQVFGLLLLGQLAIIAVSKPRAALFMASLTCDQVEEFQGILKTLEKEWGKMSPLPKEFEILGKNFDQLKSAVDAMRRNSARGSFGGGGVNLSTLTVSHECAAYLGGIAVAQAIKRGTITGALADTLGGASRELMGAAEFKTALSSSDIPLPTEYSGQVVELVGQFGAARKYGTVFPLGAGTVKLPKLSTDPTFGLIAASGTVTEKSPQTAWVTFTPEKFGGMIRLPTELEEDSIVPIGQFIARYSARQIARVEDTNFFAGTGADSGVNGAVAGLTSSTITNSKVTQLASTKTHYSDAALADFRTLRTVPDASAIRNGAYYLHPTFEGLLATFNTSGNRPYNPNAQLMNPDKSQPFVTGPTLDGFPIRWIDTLPAYSTSANVSLVFALFGDLSFQYLGIRGGIRFDTSLDAGFTTDEILIRAVERFTIGLMANGAMAGLQTAAS